MLPCLPHSLMSPLALLLSFPRVIRAPSTPSPFWTPSYSLIALRASLSYFTRPFILSFHLPASSAFCFLTLIFFFFLFFLKKTWGTHTSALSQSLNFMYNLTSSFLASSCFVEVVVSQCINTPDASSISARTSELEPFLLCLLISPLSPHQLEIMTPAHL